MFRHRRLLAFEAVCRYGSALKAADHIHMAQPSVTAAITALEGDVAASLCDRTSKGMTPTPEGTVFLARVRAALLHLKDAESLIATRRSDRTRVPLHRLVTGAQMRALTAVIQAGSFSEAARRLDLSQPSIHRSVRELETLCGIALIRDQPTPEARELARYFALYQAELQMGLDEIREIQGRVEGTVTVGALPLARSGWLPDAVAATLADYPYARIRIIDGPYEAQLHDLLHGQIDFILGALRDPVPSKLIEQRHLFDDPLTIVVRADHPLAPGFDSDHDKLTPAQLGSLAWILPRPGTPGRTVFEQFMANKGLTPPRRVVECASLVAARALLLRTDMAALLSARQVEYEIRQGLLKIMGPPLTGSTRSIGITTRTGFSPTRLHVAMLRQLGLDG
ncbi:bacterial regulatory helix-turn-helix protein, lysR family protein [Asticcacaulis biprosthecium C19]|uniref:Bacterial regulatory helix-turn-helix protein, lysR family protein n=1 Tax=Asticcacaulis biprosthecium C19 TaxID=715226 RepID=F4QP00_9CAUL|nr:LysR family transcriptional regulator [Asticcacaulis biprosthecium]EGF91058.1 bacterial regulatory helix-turn-helix protein, lysR family protein [Asticcacaulis biprosthecium C19]